MGRAPGTNVIRATMRTAKAGNPALADTGQQTLPGCRSDRTIHRERRHRFGLSRLGHRDILAIAQCVRRVHFRQRQLLERHSALHSIQIPNAREPDRKHQQIHAKPPSSNRIAPAGLDAT